MREYVVTGTSKRCLTVPAVARRKVGINVSDQAFVVIEDENGASLRRTDHDVSSVRE
jgi:bifunctional DNA-binding transcriptional regulator/antitoxin component of YhaV-PrlF toxin-antitoxin module